MPTSTPAKTVTAPAPVAPNEAIQYVLNRYKPVIAKLLSGTGTSEETFVAQIANALRATPKLWSCEPETVLGAALRCAQLALPPNDGSNLSWIIPYKTTATFQLGYGGVMELARRAEPGLTFQGRPVYPNDLFSIDFGRTPPLKHVPAASRRTRDRSRGGEALAWYVVARYPDGREHVHMLDREGVEYHRSFSKQPDGEMWANSYDAAALKSVVLDMRRWLPTSRQLAVAVSADGAVHDVRDMASAGEVTSTDTPALGEGAPLEDPGPDEIDEAWVAEARGES